MFCYGPDIAQLEACWLSVKRAFQEKRIESHQEAVKIFFRTFHDHHSILISNVKAVKSRWNAAMFVSVIRKLLPEGVEETTCETMYEIFHDMDWTFYLKLVHGLELEEELRDCLCQLEEEIYIDVLKLIMETCQQDEELKISRMANPILSSIFKRYLTLKPAKRYHQVISSAALWLLEIKPEAFKDFSTYFECFLGTATAFSDMLINVIADHLYDIVGENYKIGVVPKIKNLKPFTSAKHWIHMTRLFHNYICPHHWFYINNNSDKMHSIHFLMRCVTLFQTDIFHPVKKPKLLRVFRKQDKNDNNLAKFFEEEQKDIDDHLESLEEYLVKLQPQDSKKVMYLKTFVSRHVVYHVMQKLLNVCIAANEESKKKISIHFLNMCEQSLLPSDIILGLYLDICQGSEILKQPEFTTEITTFLNQATESHQVDKLVPPMVQLCLQSPKTVAFNVIHRALESKGHIPTLAKLLSEVSIICRFKEKSQPCNLLTSRLKSFSKKASNTKQVENLTYFVQELVKFKAPKDALDLSEFTSVVIVPLLRPDSNSLQTDLACQLLHIVLDSSSTILSCNVTVLAVTLVHFANRYLNSAELIKTDRFFSLLKKMKTQMPENFPSLELEWLKKQLKDFHPILRVKAAAVFGLPLSDYSIQGINNLERALLQSTCTEDNSAVVMATKHLNSLSHALRYAALVASLSKVLPVISQVDWVPVLHLVSILLTDIFEQNNKQEENERTVLMLRATTDALVVHHKKCLPTNWIYVLSSYGQSVKHFTSSLEEKDTVHVSYAFCEVCRLANALPNENSQHLLVCLLHLAKQAMPSDQDHKVMLKMAVNGLSSQNLKTSLQTHLESGDEE